MNKNNLFAGLLILSLSLTMAGCGQEDNTGATPEESSITEDVSTSEETSTSEEAPISTEETSSAVPRREFLPNSYSTIDGTSGTFCSAIEADKVDLELPQEDTIITFTVVTATTVDAVELYWLESTEGVANSFDDIINARANGNIAILKSLSVDDSKLTDEMVLDEVSENYYSVTKDVEEDRIIWTIRWDLGNNAVNFVQVCCVSNEAGKAQIDYVKLNLHYPASAEESTVGSP